MFTLFFHFPFRPPLPSPSIQDSISETKSGLHRSIQMKTMGEFLHDSHEIDDLDMQEIGKFLSFASRGDRVGLNQMLIQGMSPDVQNYDNRTALHLAASEGHTSIVELLVCYKGNVNLQDRWQRTPLTDARLYDHPDICRILELNGGKEFCGIQAMFGCKDCQAVGYEQDYSHDVMFDMTELNTYDSSPVNHQGSFGESEKVKWRGTWVVKTLVKGHVCAEDNTLILRELKHPNILQCLGSNMQQGEVVLITEYLPKGNLHDILKRRTRLDMPIALRYALDIARGMNYLHKHVPYPIVHRRLDTKNLLLDEGGHLKIGEYWIQILYEQINQDHNEYFTKIDIWAFGFIYYQMLEGMHIQTNTNTDKHELVKFELKFHFSRCSNRIQELIEKCTSDHPSRRPTFEDIIHVLEEEKLSLGRAVCRPVC